MDTPKSNCHLHSNFFVFKRRSEMHSEYKEKQEDAKSGFKAIFNGRFANLVSKEYSSRQHLTIFLPYE